MASRCAVMNRGLLQQVGTPGDLYEFPNSRFVADFIGIANMFDGVVAGEDPAQIGGRLPRAGARPCGLRTSASCRWASR